MQAAQRPREATADGLVDSWDEVIRVHLSGVFHGMKVQIEAMLRTGGGSIVNVASILGAMDLTWEPACAAAPNTVRSG